MFALYSKSQHANTQKRKRPHNGVRINFFTDAAQQTSENDKNTHTNDPALSRSSNKYKKHTSGQRPRTTTTTTTVHVRSIMWRDAAERELLQSPGRLYGRLYERLYGGGEVVCWSGSGLIEVGGRVRPSRVGGPYRVSEEASRGPKHLPRRRLETIGEGSLRRKSEEGVFCEGAKGGWLSAEC